MEIRYKNKRIRDICENEKKAIKKYNKIIAEKLIFSIEFLKNSKSLKDVADYNNFRLHELKYERKGQFAIDLGKTTGYRLNYRTCYCQQRKWNNILWKYKYCWNNGGVKSLWIS